MSSLSDFIGAGGAKVWVSGSTVKQWQYVISPLDGELYQRITATGAGTTDPADDITNYAARSYDRVSALPIVNITTSSGGVTNVFNGVTRVSAGVINIGVRASILSITGRGRVGFLGFFKAATGGGTLELFIDGRQVTSGSIGVTSADASLLIGSAGGHYNGTSYLNLYNALPMGDVDFRRSLEVFFTPAGNATLAASTLMYSVQGVA